MPLCTGICKGWFTLFHGTPNPTTRQVCQKCTHIADANTVEEEKYAQLVRQCTRCATTAFPMLHEALCPICIDECINRKQPESIEASPDCSHKPHQSVQTLHNAPAPSAALRTVESILETAAQRYLEGNGHRLAQEVKFDLPHPSPLSANLTQAHKKKRALEQAKAAGKASVQTKAFTIPVLNVVLRCAMFIAGNAYAKPKQLPAIRDIAASFSYVTPSLDAFESLMDAARERYTKLFEDSLGPFPSGVDDPDAEVTFELPQTGKLSPAIESEWISSTTSIGELVDKLKEAQNYHPQKGKLLIVLTFHQGAFIQPSRNTTPSKSKGNLAPVNESSGATKKRDRSDSVENPNSINASATRKRVKIASVSLEKGADAGNTNDEPYEHANQVEDANTTHTGSTNDEPDEHANQLKDANTTPADPDPLAYIRHDIAEIVTATVSDDGSVYMDMDSPGPASILMADGEPRDLGNPALPGSRALLGVGFYKFAVRGMTEDGREVSIAQCLPREDITDKANYDSLESECAALALAQHYWNKMAADAARLLVKLPAIRFNTEGTIIGCFKAAGARPFGGPSADSWTPPPHDRPLPYAHFLLSPLLKIDNDQHREVRFGQDNIHNRWDEADVNDVLGAFLHHAFLQSNRTLLFKDLQGVMQPGGGCILFDPQYDTIGGMSAPWDCGKIAIEIFQAEHKCRAYCRCLGLTPNNL